MRAINYNDIIEFMGDIKLFLENYSIKGEDYCRVGETVGLFNEAKENINNKKMLPLFDLLVDKSKNCEEYTFNIVKNPEDNYDIFLIPRKTNFSIAEYDKLIKILVENKMEAEVVPDVSKEDTKRFLIALYLYLKGKEIYAKRESEESSQGHIAPVDKEIPITYFVGISKDATLINVIAEKREVIYPDGLLPFSLSKLEIIDRLIGYSFYDIYEQVLDDPYLGTKIHKIGTDAILGKNIHRLV